jgi:hypothetical protein
MLGGLRTVKVQVFDVYPTTLGHCPHYNLFASEMAAAGAEFCELSNQALEYPPDVIKSHERAARIAEFLAREAREMGLNVEVEMVNLFSPGGLLKALRHGVLGRFAVVVDGRKVCEGEMDWAGLREAVISSWRMGSATG